MGPCRLLKTIFAQFLGKYRVVSALFGKIERLTFTGTFDAFQHLVKSHSFKQICFPHRSEMGVLKSFHKAKHEGRIFAKIGTFFPSSKTCSTCGHKLKELSLATRSWTCPHCGAHHDRDINASLNIKQEGIRKLKAAGLTVLRS